MRMTEWEAPRQCLGDPIRLVSVQSAVATCDDGVLRAYVVLRGKPASLVVLALPGTTPTAVYALPEAEGAENLLLRRNGEVVVPTHPWGKLFCFDPSLGRLRRIEHGLGEVRFIWDVAESPDGTVYAGCWPGARLFAVEPRTLRIVDFGCVAPGEDYVRALAYDATRGRLYLGIGSHAQLLEYDPQEDRLRPLLASPECNRPFVNALALAGPLLFARVTGPEETLVFEVGDSGVRLMSKMPPLDARESVVVRHEREVLVGASGQIFAYDPRSHTARLHIARQGSPVRAAMIARVGRGRPACLNLLTRDGDWETYGLEGEPLAKTRLELPPQPILLQQVASGPDGRIYTSGYVVGGIGIYDPGTGAVEQVGGAEQAESMAHDGQCLYLGTYPHAVIMRFDPRRPPDQGNPCEVFRLSPWNQDRPYAMVVDRARQQLYVGTVPEYGRLGGALAIHELATGRTRIHVEVIRRQSVVSLATDGRWLYGATSTSGGLGIAPEARSAVLFGFDPERDELLFVATPVEGKRGITGLVCDSRGILYGWAEGTLFAFVPGEQRVLWAETLFESTYPTDHYWRGIQMRPSLTEADVFYGAAWGTIFRFSARELLFSIVARIPNAEVVAPGVDGCLYAIADTALWRIDVSSAS